MKFVRLCNGMKFVHPLVEICIPLHFGVMFAAAGLGCAIKLCKYWGGVCLTCLPLQIFLLMQYFFFTLWSTDTAFQY